MATEAIKQLVDEATNIVGFSGAGISTESGIPDFRSPNGIWATNRTVMYDEFLTRLEGRIEYWRQKAAIWPEMRVAKPNSGHFFFEKLNKAGKLKGMITQNIEGLHQASGLPADKLIEIHGTMKYVTCIDCGSRISMDEACERIEAGEKAPLCQECEGYLKPATISFGQSLNPKDLDQALQWSANCDLMIAVGSSLVVQPAASFPMVAKENGAKLIIINRDDTPLDSVADVVIHGEIGKTLEGVI